MYTSYMEKKNHREGMGKPQFWPGAMHYLKYGWLNTDTITSGVATYIMVYSPTVASHIDFFELAFRRKTYIILNMTKALKFFTFLFHFSYETRSLYDTFPKLYKQRFVMPPKKNPPLFMQQYPLSYNFFCVVILPSSVLKGLSHQIDLTFDFMYTVQYRPRSN